MSFAEESVRKGFAEYADKDFPKSIERKVVDSYDTPRFKVILYQLDFQWSRPAKKNTQFPFNSDMNEPVDFPSKYFVWLEPKNAADLYQLHNLSFTYNDGFGGMFPYKLSRVRPRHFIFFGETHSGLALGKLFMELFDVKIESPFTVAVPENPLAVK